jgi:protein tyrosine/serine phosphatase
MDEIQTEGAPTVQPPVRPDARAGTSADGASPQQAQPHQARPHQAQAYQTHAYQTQWIDLDGAHNVRDVGGLRAGDRTVRPRVLLRGDHLDDLSPAAADRLCDEIGLRAVVDLRAHWEEPQAGAWAEGRGIDRLHLPLIDMTRVDAARHPHADDRERSVAVYERMLLRAAPALVDILRFVTTGPRTPVLVHCAAGKDRTGITVAVLLAAAGVAYDDIVADYVVTGERLARIRANLSRRPIYQYLSEPPPEPAPLLADPIQAVLASLDEFGGSLAFLREHGAPDEALSAWPEILLTPSH